MEFYSGIIGDCFRHRPVSRYRDLLPSHQPLASNTDSVCCSPANATFCMLISCWSFCGAFHGNTPFCCSIRKAQYNTLCAPARKSFRDRRQSLVISRFFHAGSQYSSVKYLHAAADFFNFPPRSQIGSLYDMPSSLLRTPSRTAGIPLLLLHRVSPLRSHRSHSALKLNHYRL